MPTRLMLLDGCEYVVSESYAVALERVFATDAAAAEFTVLHWNDPEADEFDESSPKPVYSESIVTVRPQFVVAVEREESWVVEIIDRCRRYRDAAD